MTDPRTFYNSQINRYNTHLKKASQKLAFSSLLRLTVFLAMAFLVYFFFGNITAVVATILIGIAIFLVLVSRHSDLKYERDKNRELIRINETELSILERNFRELPTGSEFEDPEHPFSQDIDLFGSSSFFQYMNRTALVEGKQQLADLLLSNNIDKIERKQDAIKELADKADWRQNFSALATLVKTETRTGTILKWLREYEFFVPAVMKWLPWLFSAISLVVIAAFFMDYIGGIELAIWFFVGLMITGIYVKKINLLSSKVSKVQDTFHQYYQLLALIENTEFSSELLKEQKDLITSEGQKASQTIMQYS